MYALIGHSVVYSSTDRQIKVVEFNISVEEAKSKLNIQLHTRVIGGLIYNSTRSSLIYRSKDGCAA